MTLQLSQVLHALCWILLLLAIRRVAILGDARRNFGMPRPEGYRKALRVMKLAEVEAHYFHLYRYSQAHILALVLAGAVNLQAIGQNLYAMAGSKCNRATIIGEGGSGGL